MLINLESYCLEIAMQHYPLSDPSHDIGHIMRVVANAKLIQSKEGWDLDIILPAAYFHDIVNYPKHSELAPLSTKHSAELAKKLLEEFEWYDTQKIQGVMYAIEHCSFTKKLDHDTLESQILQDADLLESLGAISLMRTCASSWVMQRPLIDMQDPFAQHRQLDPKISALDLIPYRLLKVKERMLTDTGKRLAEDRHEFLWYFLNQVRKELLL